MKVVKCSACPVLTREPFWFRDEPYCARCMEDISPDRVAKRERHLLTQNPRRDPYYRWRS